MATKAALPKKSKSSIHENRLKAVSHPLRANCLRLLDERGELSPIQVTRELGEDNLTDVSYHMKRLAELGCAEVVRTRPVRGAVEHFYVATDRSSVNTDEWDDLDPLEADYFVGQIMQSILDDFVASRRSKIVGRDNEFHMTRTSMILDDEGLEAGMEAYERLRLEMAEIEGESVERRKKSKARGTRVSSSLLFFKAPKGAR
jgi:DNA-binding transcriptional ArsR family regulator